MAVLAPIAVFVAIPSGATALAGTLLILVAVLDVVVAYALAAVLDPGDSLLARTTTGLRLTYAAAFAVASSRLLTADDVSGFEQIWDASLFLFSWHLLAAGLLGWRSGVLPRWIALLVMLSGAGYLIDALGPVLDAEPSVASVSFVGEVVLLLWLLVRGGKAATPQK